MNSSSSGMWSSRLIFILAAAGSAVGLGNIWRFPYVAGENGGGVFVLAYLLCICVIGLPIMIAEIVLGRAGKNSPIASMRILARDSGTNPAWQIIGWMGVVAGFMILSFYSVIAGWALAYFFKMVIFINFAIFFFKLCNARIPFYKFDTSIDTNLFSLKCIIKSRTN